ncbi:MAG: GxxExxY protein [Anaerolineales bacterium]
MKHQDLSKKIIASFYTVYNALGYGFLELVYPNAMVIELTKQGLGIKSQHPVPVFYENQVIGQYYADLLVDDCIIVELKAVNTLAVEHKSQVINYLNATRFEVGLLLNFGKTPQIKRVIFDNDRKKYRHVKSDINY